MKHTVKVRIDPNRAQRLTLPSLKTWRFSLLRESLESTELNPDTSPDLKTAQRAFLGIAHPYLELILYITGLPKGRGLRPMIFGLKKHIPPLKREYPWLREIYSQLLQSSVMNLSRAFVNFLEGRAQFPRLKAKHGKQSIQYPQHVKFEDNCLHFPKIGWVKAKIHRVFDGNLKTVTVSQTKRGHYYASLLFDDGKPEPQPSNEGKAVGIELGY
ncbi:MAG: hypothetical protein BRC36_03905 [Cyanobacteria bacterium QH_2_48_84]|nr:MAG: hypothetical protein BRC36_03905 [Cyanobacteria bacterium QH_2_48_84]